MGNLSTYTRSTELGLMARDMRAKPRPAVYAEDAEGKVKVDERGKKIVVVPAKPGTAFRQALARLFTMKPLSPVAAARDRKAERARPGCKALRAKAA